MNCKNNNTKSRSLPAAEPQWEWARCSLAKGSSSTTLCDVCRGSGKAASSWVTQLHRSCTAAPLLKLWHLSTPWDPPACPPGTSSGQLLHENPPRSTAGSGALAMLPVHWHTHTPSWLFEILTAASASPPSPNSLLRWLWSSQTHLHPRQLQTFK